MFPSDSAIKLKPYVYFPPGKKFHFFLEFPINYAFFYKTKTTQIQLNGLFPEITN